MSAVATEPVAYQSPQRGDVLIDVSDLVKRYPKASSNAVDGVSFSVRAGEIFALLGPNGAGKSTTTGVLTTRISLTSGSAMVAGVDIASDPVAARGRISAVPQRMTLDRSMNARQNLLFHAAYHDVPKKQRARRADEMLEAFRLTDQAKVKPDFMSGGQQQRLMIARALMHQPEVLFLDEPTTGLDPQVRRWVWERVNELRAEGAAILLTTHYMDEAAELADRVAIMDHGKLLVVDTPEALTVNLPGTTTLEAAAALPSDASVTPLVEALSRIRGVERVERVQRGDQGSADGEQNVRTRLYLSAEVPEVIASVTAMIAESGARLTDIAIGRPSLEDIFIGMTGRSLR